MMFRKLFTIARYTFSEFIKGKILFITVAVGLATMLMTFIATEFSYGVPEKIALDFGLGMLSLSSLAISIFMGANLLPKEIDSRTVYMVISRPVPRYVFICGKLLGLVAILAVNIILLSIMTLACATFLGGKIDSLILISIFYNFLESSLLLFVVVFFSLFSNITISIVFSILLLLSGHAIIETQDTLFVTGRPYLKTILDFYHLVLPAFYKLNLKDFVVYNQSLPTSYLVNTIVYGISYSVFLFLMIINIFNKKNLD